MNDIEQMLERQARWQKSRQALSWPEKIRMAERIRESARLLRASGKVDRTSTPDTGTQHQPRTASQSLRP